MDSNNGSQSTKGKYSPVASASVTETFGTPGIVMMIFAFIALGLASWAAGRVQTLADRQSDQQAANQRAVQQLSLEYQHELESARTDFLKLDRQYRMTELKLDDWTVVAHRAGLQIPGDYTRGPQGALDAESFHIPQSKPKGK